MGFQDGAGTSWDLLLIRSWGGQVYLLLSPTLSLLQGEGDMVGQWGGGRGREGAGSSIAEAPRALMGPILLS